MYKMLDKCPVCKSKIIISEIECSSCGCIVKQKFEPQKKEVPRKDADKEIEDFIKVFIFTEGSIKQTEKMLNCSYPKVKNLLKKAKKYLDVSEGVDKSSDESETDDVLDLLYTGEIDVEEALKMLGDKK